MPKGLSGLVGGGDGLSSLIGGNGDSGSDEDDEEATEAYGSGRRMPMQQAVDVAVPITEAYNLWTEFEEWPSFMHRVDSAQQIDDCDGRFLGKGLGNNQGLPGRNLEQRPDERIVWDVNEGLKHSGVVTFHKLAPRLTRIEITVDVKPDSLLEKAGRGMRFTKRAVRGDLHRFKAYAEMEEESEEGGWRGTIEDGEVKEKDRPEIERFGLQSQIPIEAKQEWLGPGHKSSRSRFPRLTERRISNMAQTKTKPKSKAKTRTKTKSNTAPAKAQAAGRALVPDRKKPAPNRNRANQGRNSGRKPSQSRRSSSNQVDLRWTS